MMNRNLRRFAVIGLVIAGIATLVSISLFIVQRAFNLPLQISLGFIILGLALYVLLDPERTRELLTGRQARHGSNAFLMSFAFIGIVVVINFFVYNNSRRWDLTEGQQNTLTPETLETLKSLAAPVKAEAYYTARMASDQTEKLLRNYQTNSGGKFTYEFIDPEKDPVRTQQAQVTRDGTIILRMEDRQEQVAYAGEQDLTAGLVRLANPGTRAVYFLIGHDENSIDSTAEFNYSTLVSDLKAKNYTVSTLNLIANPTIPDDALAVIIAGPKKPVSDQETTLIQSYLENGGSLIYLPEPLLFTQFGDQPDPIASLLENNWGISLGNDVIIDVNQNNDQPLRVVSDRFNSHPITQRMYSYVVVLPTVRSVQALESPEAVQLTELALTTENAWGETDMEALSQQQASPDQAVDVMGPVPFAVAGENQAASARVVVIGDSEFMGTGYYEQYGNSDFILNSIDWAAQQDNLISLTPRQPVQRFMLPPQPQTLNLVLFGSVFLLPGMVIFSGIYVWFQRRRKG
jgi:ABC-type uncharacterized transport system involved in gliding motility auxiliary subunit